MDEEDDSGYDARSNCASSLNDSKLCLRMRHASGETDCSAQSQTTNLLSGFSSPTAESSRAFSSRAFSSRPFSSRAFSSRPFSSRPFSSRPFNSMYSGQSPNDANAGQESAYKSSDESLNFALIHCPYLTRTKTETAKEKQTDRERRQTESEIERSSPLAEQEASKPQQSRFSSETPFVNVDIILPAEDEDEQCAPESVRQSLQRVLAKERNDATDSFGQERGDETPLSSVNLPSIHSSSIAPLCISEEEFASRKSALRERINNTFRILNSINNNCNRFRQTRNAVNAKLIRDQQTMVKPDETAVEQLAGEPCEITEESMASCSSWAEPPCLASEAAYLASETAYLASKPPHLASNAPRLASNPPRLASNPPRLASNPPRLASNPPRLESKAPHLETKAPHQESEPPHQESEPPHQESKASHLESKPPHLTSKPPLPVAAQSRQHFANVSPLVARQPLVCRQPLLARQPLGQDARCEQIGQSIRQNDYFVLDHNPLTTGRLIDYSTVSHSRQSVNENDPDDRETTDHYQPNQYYPAESECSSPLQDIMSPDSDELESDRYTADEGKVDKIDRQTNTEIDSQLMSRILSKLCVHQKSVDIQTDPVQPKPNLVIRKFRDVSTNTVKVNLDSDKRTDDRVKRATVGSQTIHFQVQTCDQSAGCSSELQESEKTNGEKNEEKNGEKSEVKNGEKSEVKNGEKSEEKNGEKSEKKNGEKSEKKNGEKSEKKNGEKSEQTIEQTNEQINEKSEKNEQKSEKENKIHKKDVAINTVNIKENQIDSENESKIKNQTNETKLLKSKNDSEKVNAPIQTRHIGTNTEDLYKNEKNIGTNLPDLMNPFSKDQAIQCSDLSCNKSIKTDSNILCENESNQLRPNQSTSNKISIGTDTGQDMQNEIELKNLIQTNSKQIQCSLDLIKPSISEKTKQMVAPDARFEKHFNQNSISNNSTQEQSSNQLKTDENQVNSIKINENKLNKSNTNQSNDVSINETNLNKQKNKRNSHTYQENLLGSPNSNTNQKEDQNQTNSTLSKPKNIKTHSKIIIELMSKKKKETSEIDSITEMNDDGKLMRKTQVTNTKEIPLRINQGKLKNEMLKNEPFVTLPSSTRSSRPNSRADIDTIENQYNSQIYNRSFTPSSETKYNRLDPIETNNSNHSRLSFIDDEIEVNPLVLNENQKVILTNNCDQLNHNEQGVIWKEASHSVITSEMTADPLLDANGKIQPTKSVHLSTITKFDNVDDERQIHTNTKVKRKFQNDSIHEPIIESNCSLIDIPPEQPFSAYSENITNNVKHSEKSSVIIDEVQDSRSVSRAPSRVGFCLPSESSVESNAESKCEILDDSDCQTDSRKSYVEKNNNSHYSTIKKKPVQSSKVKHGKILSKSKSTESFAKNAQIDSFEKQSNRKTELLETELDSVDDQMICEKCSQPNDLSHLAGKFRSPISTNASLASLSSQQSDHYAEPSLDESHISDNKTELNHKQTDSGFMSPIDRQVSPENHSTTPDKGFDADVLSQEPNERTLQLSAQPDGTEIVTRLTKSSYPTSKGKSSLSQRSNGQGRTDSPVSISSQNLSNLFKRNKLVFEQLLQSPDNVSKSSKQINPQKTIPIVAKRQTGCKINSQIVMDLPISRSKRSPSSTSSNQSRVSRNHLNSRTVSLEDLDCKSILSQHSYSQKSGEFGTVTKFQRCKPKRKYTGSASQRDLSTMLMYSDQTDWDYTMQCNCINGSNANVLTNVKHRRMLYLPLTQYETSL